MSRVRDVRVNSVLWKGSGSDYIFVRHPKRTSQTYGFKCVWLYFEDTSSTGYQGVEVFVVWWYHMLGVLAINGYSLSVDI